MFYDIWSQYKHYINLLSWGKPRNLEFKNIYVSPIAVQIYTWFEFEVSEEARKMTLYSEYLLLGEARRGICRMVIAKKQKKTSSTKPTQTVLFPFMTLLLSSNS